MRRAGPHIAIIVSFLLPATLAAAAPKAPPPKMPQTRAQKEQASKPSTKQALERANFPADTPGWFPVTPMPNARTYFTATLLQNGTVLVAGGSDSVNILSTCELYKPDEDAWLGTGPMVQARETATATLLRNGKVLVVGGDYEDTVLASSELYDPVSEGWISTAGALAAERTRHTATLLPDGKVLVTGGNDSSGPLSSAELFDPVTESWSLATSMGTARVSHTATLLPGGKVLVVGGDSGSGPSLSSAEVYDPGAGTWLPTDDMIEEGGRSNHTATLMADGRVLVAGGLQWCTNYPTCDESAILGTTQIFDPDGTPEHFWTAADEMAVARLSHTATLLPNGKVLVVGGLGDAGSLASAEVFDPGPGLWGTGGGLEDARQNHTATVLPSGDILVVGGEDSGVYLSTAQKYTPEPGFEGAWRPVLTSVTPPVCPGETQMIATGSNFQGLSECSGGNGGQNSSTNYPLLQIHSLVDFKDTYLLSDPGDPWSGTHFRSIVVPLAAIPAGAAEVRIVANGIPSLPQEIVINAPVSLVTSPSPTTVCAGSNGVFTVGATGSDLAYQWQINQGVGWEDLADAAPYSGVSTAELTITGATLGMDGMPYRCEVSGPCGGPATSDSATLTVLPVTPTITGPSSNPCPSVVAELATQTGMSDYQWYLGGDPITDATGAAYTATVSGTYTVRYTNACGTGTSGGKAVTITGCAPPPETAPGTSPSTAQSWSGKQTITWPVNAGATSGYHLYRGVRAELPNLLSTNIDSCTRATTPDASSNTATGITEEPSGVAGRFYWYLVTGLNWTEGTAGNATAGERTVNSSGACP